MIFVDFFLSIHLIQIKLVFIKNYKWILSFEKIRMHSKCFFHQRFSESFIFTQEEFIESQILFEDSPKRKYIVAQESILPFLVIYVDEEPWKLSVELINRSFKQLESVVSLSDNDHIFPTDSDFQVLIKHTWETVPFQVFDDEELHVPPVIAAD